MDDSPQTTIPGSAATEKPAQLWNSLEIAKFTMSVIFAVVGGLFTLFTYEQAHREKTAETNRQNEVGRQAKIEKAAERRVAVWQEASPTINDIYVYMMFIGEFKDMTPTQMIDDKRKLDRLMYSNQVLFTKEYFKAYQDFMNTAYAPCRGWLKDAALRTIPIRPHDNDVIPGSNHMKAEFTGEDCRNEVFAAYWNLQKLSGSELNVYNPDPGKQPDATKAEGIPQPLRILIAHKGICAATPQ